MATFCDHSVVAKRRVKDGMAPFQRVAKRSEKIEERFLRGAKRGGGGQ
jgi:hypothetical protein